MFATNIISSAGEKLAHELIGHGLSFFNQGVGSQHVNSIQASNLYKRVTSGGSYRFYRNGASHSNRVTIPGTISWQVPLYLK
ncbi:hypothetical protein [Aquimarina algiphila]|uniref:hypothetical protein n=1 Tax=Aquimarina algiphila TaxID=2047982 RepID=UPI00249304B6|nr:hypothetical protein [Aquimarina algiphila]